MIGTLLLSVIITLFTTAAVFKLLEIRKNKKTANSVAAVSTPPVMTQPVYEDIELVSNTSFMTLSKNIAYSNTEQQ